MPLTHHDIDSLLSTITLPNDAWRGVLKKKCTKFDVATFVSMMQRIATLPPETKIEQHIDSTTGTASSDVRLASLELELEAIKSDMALIHDSLTNIVRATSTTTVPAIKILTSTNSSKEYIERNKFWSDFATKFIQLLADRFDSFDVYNTKEHFPEIVKACLEVAFERLSLSDHLSTKTINIRRRNSPSCYTVTYIPEDNTLNIDISIEALHSQLCTGPPCPYKWTHSLQRLLYDVVVAVAGYQKSFEDFAKSYLPLAPENGNRFWPPHL